MNPLSLALRVLAGDVPHRDFYTQYGPAQLHLFAWIFRAFGVSLLPVVIVEMVTRGSTLAVVYLFLRECCRVSIALGGVGVVSLVLATLNYPIASYEILLPVFSCAWLASRTFEHPQTLRHSLLYGSLCALATMFRYEQGVMLLLLYVLILVLAKRSSPAWKSDDWGALFRRASVACGSFAALSGAWIAFLARTHALGGWWYQCFAFPRHYYAAARRLPFPRFSLRHPSTQVIYLLFAILALATIHLVLLWVRNEAGMDRRFGVQTFLTLLLFSYVLKGSVRIDVAQLAPAIVAAMCLAIIISARRSSASAIRMYIVMLGICLAVFSAYNFLAYFRALIGHRYSVVQQLMLGHDTQNSTWCDTSSPMTRGFCFVIDQDHHDAVQYLAQRMHPGDPLFVGVPRHDHIFASDNLFYFAANAVPAVRWSNFDPDLQSRSDIQRDMIASLRSRPPRFVVETSQFEIITEPNDSSVYTQVFLLDDYLAANYHIVQRFGQLSVFEKNTQ